MRNREGLNAMGPSVAVFGINSYPEEIGIAPYTTGMVRYLSNRDWHVEFITGLPHYPNWSVPDDYHTHWRRGEEFDGIPVTRLRHSVPERQSALRRGIYEATFFANGVASPPFKTVPDLFVGIVPSLSGGLLAATYAKRYRRPSVIVVQDLMANAAAQSGIPGGGKAAGATRILEGFTLRRADHIIVVAEAFRRTVREYRVAEERISEIRNWSHIDAPCGDRAAMRAKLGWRADEQIVLHAGNMGLKQALEYVVDAARIAEERSPRTRFVLMGGGSQRALLEEQARGLSNVTFLDAQPSVDFPDVLAAADVLLVNERASVIDMSLPSKLTSYFRAGRPVLAAVPNGSTAAEIRRSGGGIVVPAEASAEIVAAVQRLAADPELAGRLGTSGRDYAERALSQAAVLSSYETLFHSVIERSKLAVAPRVAWQ
jgi:glycosyltransferase involved in cell wall biosynthesis